MKRRSFLLRRSKFIVPLGYQAADARREEQAGLFGRPRTFVIDRVPCVLQTRGFLQPWACLDHVLVADVRATSAHEIHALPGVL
jgi:hypothetical protein